MAKKKEDTKRNYATVFQLVVGAREHFETYAHATWEELLAAVQAGKHGLRLETQHAPHRDMWEFREMTDGTGRTSLYWQGWNGLTGEPVGVDPLGGALGGPAPAPEPAGGES